MNRFCFEFSGWSRLLIAVACIAVSAPVTRADERSAGPSAPPPADVSGPAENKEKPDFPPFDEVSKDHEIKVGFFDVYYDKKKDHALLVVPSSMLGKNFLIASSISGGSPFTGFMWMDQVVQWREIGKQLVLLEPDTRHKQAKDASVKDVIARTYTDQIVLATKIVSKRNADFVIDLDDVFKKDRVALSAIHRGGMNASLSRWAKIKNFEKNLELTVDAAIMNGSDGGTRALVHYSISELPENDYKPRQADDRVGYFMTAVKDWGREHNAKTIFDRYIHRWRLRKADPKAPVSDVHPDDQIIFYIEKTVPIKYRRYVREGILEWNKAFEKAGLLNAVAVRQQTDTNEWKDLDPEDVRYNFFRWIVSGRAFAMGPSRVNPMTGQILDADIVWDDSLTRSLLTQYARYGARGLGVGYDPQLDEFLNRHPRWRFVSQSEAVTPENASYGGVDLSTMPDVLNLLGNRQQLMCTCAEGMRHEMALAGFVSQWQGNDGLSEEFIGQFIKYVVAHEVGHTMGLRHNFKGSSWKSVAELMSNKDRNEPTSGSVMDYNAALFGKTQEEQPNYVTPALGPYDYWAIEYGYRHTDDEFKTEEELLKSIAAHGNEPGLAYATDEDTGFFAPDPTVNRWDNGSDPIEYANNRMEMVRRLRDDVASWAVEDGESYSRLRRVFDAMLAEYGRAALFAARYVGGQYLTRNHKGDANEQLPFQVVAAAKQRQALEFLADNVFSDTMFQFDPELLNKLAAGRWRHWDTDDFDSPREYPIHDRIAATQYWAMFQLLNPFTISRIYDAELKVPAEDDAMTVPELVERTTQAVWLRDLDRKTGGNEWSNRRPFISSIRRNLQRNYLRVMLDTVLGPPGESMPADAHAVIRMTLSDLSERIGKLLESDGRRLDAFTRAHLDESKSRIDKAMEAVFRL